MAHSGSFLLPQLPAPGLDGLQEFPVHEHDPQQSLVALHGWYAFLHGPGVGVGGGVGTGVGGVGGGVGGAGVGTTGVGGVGGGVGGAGVGGELG